MTRREVFACLDAIGNRYGREAAVMGNEKDSTAIDDDAIMNDRGKLEAMGVKVS